MTTPSAPFADGAPPIVLLVNDQEWSARSLESVLGPHGFASLRAYTGRQALELARRTQPDAFIVDVGMPDVSGIEFCRTLRTTIEHAASTPIVLTTAGPASRAERLEAYKAGAWEFLSLPVDADALVLKLQVFVRAKRNVERSRVESLLDSDTGLYNVRGLARRAREIGAEATRRHASLACVVLSASPANEVEISSSDDLDPTFASQVGDICRRAARTSDAVGRMGRSEFAILAPSTDPHGAVSLAERLREQVESTEFMVEGMTQRVKVRAGYYAVTDFSTASVDPVEVLLRAATALRHVRTSLTARQISAFDDVPGRLVQ